MKKTRIHPERAQLLFGPYQPQRLGLGDRAFCLFRDNHVRITGWTEAPIPWPLCRGFGKNAGGEGPLVDEELARAVRHESHMAICYWWGVAGGAVNRWRKRLGVGRMDSEGSKRLILSALGTTTANRLNASGGKAKRDPIWTTEEIALVGVLTDREVAARTGRTLHAARAKRRLLGLPNPEYPDHKYLPWTPEQDRLLFSLPAREVAARTGHSLDSVYARKYKLLQAAQAPCHQA